MLVAFGFTLIELIGVIAILGILAAIAVPRLGAFRSRAENRADIATARTIMSAASIAEAEKGENFDADDVNANLDITITVSNAAPAEGSTGWHLNKTTPMTVYKDAEQIDLSPVD